MDPKTAPLPELARVAAEILTTLAERLGETGDAELQEELRRAVYSSGFLYGRLRKHESDGTLPKSA